jgi:hypothetical protein
MTPTKVSLQRFSRNSHAQRQEKCATLIFSDLALRERYYLRRNKLRQNFEHWRCSTSGFRRWSTEALHPPFLFF